MKILTNKQYGKLISDAVSKGREEIVTAYRDGGLYASGTTVITGDLIIPAHTPTTFYGNITCNNLIFDRPVTTAKSIDDLWSKLMAMVRKAKKQNS